MLDKLNKNILAERLNSFKQWRLTTIENIEGCKKDLEKDFSSGRNKIYMNHKKFLDSLEKSIDCLEQLQNIHFDWFKNQKLVIATSNESKLNEMKRILPEIESLPFAKDIEEVDGTIDEIILHKAKNARYENLIQTGTSIIVEDTIIRNLDTGKDITDIKWNIDILEEKTNVEWITSLALNDGINVYVFRGTQQGVVTRERGNEGFAFDPYFIPVELYQDYNKNYTINNINYGKLYPNNTLAELNKVGLKDMFSARAKALNYLSEFRLERVVNLIDIRDWEGRYQNEKPFNITFNNSYFERYLNLDENNSKLFNCVNDFKNVMKELNVDFDIDQLIDSIKRNEDIFVDFNPYRADMNSENYLCFANSLDSLESMTYQMSIDI